LYPTHENQNNIPVIIDRVDKRQRIHQFSSWVKMLKDYFRSIVFLWKITIYLATVKHSYEYYSIIANDYANTAIANSDSIV